MTADSFKISQDLIREIWGNGKTIEIDGKEYTAHRMSYGDYFLEPAGYERAETGGYAYGTLWLKKEITEKGTFTNCYIMDEIRNDLHCHC
ncbi:MAG: hypothetical protein M0R06_22370 [Sphaerochaeta sp.]|jgi:hypothetical protein|nr:hypothetical protein [Sphaerochaeta sp.]